ncbi:MAG: DNA repair exonuclease [Nanoarchaeota archaeon]|nr:DNA repair exonuclease [Nanoarchaeota archaeon]
MVRFAHIADVHLGGWRQPEMQDLNFKSFQKAIQTCIEKKVEFVLIAGDLFDTAYPPIEILKETFAEFRKLHDARIPCFIIAGSHDYSVSGKTFLDVLEKAGFCKNVFDAEEKNESIYLTPTLHQGIAIYGYPGRKSGLEIPDIRRCKLNDAPGMFKIYMLHTTIDKAKGVLPIDSLETDNLPHADYYALGHLHIDFKYENFVYPGPVFPNNFSELETLKQGSFYIVDTEATQPMEKIDIKLKKIETINVIVKNALVATERIIQELDKRDLNDKVVLLRLEGLLEDQKVSDIKFQKIEEFIKSKGAYFFLKNTHDLKVKEADMDIEIKETDDVEEESIKQYSEDNPSKFNDNVESLINALAVEKQEGETTEVFNTRLIEESQKILGF